MKNINIFLVCVFLLVSGFSIGQAAAIQDKQNIISDMTSDFGQTHINLMNSTVNSGANNSDYFKYSDWSKAEVIDNSGTTFSIDSTNYHIDEGKMIFMKNGKLLYLLPEIVERISLQGEVYASLTGKKRGTKEFYQILSEGKLTLYKKSTMQRLTKPTHPMGIKTNGDKKELVVKDKLYYASEKSKNLYELPSSKKKVIKLFRGNSEEVVQFAKANKLSVKSAIDVASMFDLYNSLN